MSKDKAEEKPYLQNLFDHMSSEYGLILTQSEMLEILSVCGKEYDNVQFEIGEIERQHSNLSAENAQLREALTHLVNLCDANSYDEVILYQMEHNIDLDTVLNQAKQLLTDKE